MSKAVISEKAEPRELKALCIIGPEFIYNPEVSKLYDREDCLIIGNGIDSIEIQNVANELKKHNVRIGPNTRIDILAHGLRFEKEHIITLSERNIRTKDFFRQLQDLTPKAPIYVQLWSCYGGTANKDISFLNPGSIIVTHIKSRYKELTEVQENARLNSITRYLNENNLNPHLQYLYDQLENYQATTFNQKDTDGHIVKFKTIRNPANESIAKKFSYILQKGISEERLIKELQEYLAFEEKRFCELFKNYLSEKDIKNFHIFISNINNKNMKDFITGTLINLIEANHNNEIKDKYEVSITLREIVFNLNSDLINNDILGVTPLFIAVDNKSISMVRILLVGGANPNAIDPIDGCTVFHNACENNFTKIANLMLEYGAKPDHPNNINSTPLMAACTNESLKLVKILLAKGAEPNRISKDNLTPLIIACSKNSEAITQILLENGADPNLKMSEGLIPLNIACSKGSEAIVLNLLKKGANPNIADYNKITPLFAAYKNNSVRITELLLQSKAEPNIINPDTGNTLLYSAYNDGNLKMFMLLMNHKAKCDFPNIDGTTTLMAACEKGDLETAILLLKYGADINKSNVKGNTPMRLACKNGNLELVKMLVENGANLEIENSDRTILSIAERYGHAKVKAFLETEINAQRILNKLDKNNPSYNLPPPKPPRLPKLENLDKKAWVSSININSNINHPQHNFFQSNRGTEDKLVKEIISSAIAAVDGINPINNETREEIKNIVSEELKKIPTSNLIVNKKVIINSLTEELKLNNQQNNNNMGYQTSQQNLREIGNRLLTRYIYRPQPATPNTHKWKSFVKPNNKDNYKGRG